MLEELNLDYDNFLNHKDSLLSQTRAITTDTTADDIYGGVFGAINSNTGIEFGVNKTTGYSFIQSRNFSTGSAGFQILSDGSVEFVTGTFSGTLSAASGTLGTITAGSISGVTITASTFKTAASGARLEVGVQAISEISFYDSDEDKCSIDMVSNNLHINSEKAGSNVRIFAKNDATVLTEVALFDGDAGFSMLTNRLDSELASTDVIVLSGSAKIALDIENAGSANSLLINQTSTSNSNILLQCHNDGTGRLATFHNDLATNTQEVIYASTDGTGYVGLFVPIDNVNRTKATLYIGANSTRGAHLNLAPIATAPTSPSAGDLYANSSGYMEYHNGTALQKVAMSDGDTGGSGSAGAGNQYIELNIGGTVYKVLHDGTV